MDPILIVGAETVIGANLCARWGERFEISGLADRRMTIADCRIVLEKPEAAEAAAAIRGAQARTVVFCGPMSRSAWNLETASALKPSVVNHAGHWAAAAASAGAHFVMISSDAVFTGPWMFHDEDSTSYCPSREARIIRDAEDSVLKNGRKALIVRTNAYGWSPAGSQGWLETLLAMIESRRSIELDAVRHATPLLATDLADILEAALAEGLSGTYHIAGAERISLLGFAQRLAGQFDLPWLPVAREVPLIDVPAGFGSGECSLQTRSVRQALCVAMPLLSESLERLELQQISGYRQRLAPNATVQLRAA